MFRKLPRLSVNWFTLPEQFRRYWDQAMSVIEEVASFDPVSVSSLSSTPTIMRSIVNDATTSTFGSIVVGGGTNTVPVYYDGTNWRIG